MELFRNFLQGTFIARPNRFVVQCLVNGRKARAYLPNPGRLWELFFPGVKLYLVPVSPSAERKLKYLVAAVERDGMPVMLHTHANNLVARKLINEGRVPGLEGAEIIQQEYRVGSSRFDFLLRKDGRDTLLEVKSCTLFNGTLAMFPDAVSARATKHLLELEELSRKGFGTAVLFVVHSPRARYFMPEHHTDLAFCRALLQVKDRVMVKAVSVEWKQDLSLGTVTREMTIPWDLVEREPHDRGSYIVVLRLPRDRRITVGGLGELKFRRGYYLYAGSAMKNLTQRLARHQRLIKNHHWHIDYLREHAEYIAGIPIRTSADIECEIAGALSGIAEWQVPGFGCSDCGCPTHLVGMAEDPFLKRPFSDLLLRFRMGLLKEELSNRAFTRR
jgi:sugar fermentation stimulation protein A